MGSQPRQTMWSGFTDLFGFIAGFAIANSPLLKADDNGVTFKYKDYRVEGRERFKTMTLGTDEFIRRFLNLSGALRTDR